MNNPVLYYSSYCSHSDSIIQYISHTKVKDFVHFMNIDNRYNVGNETYIRLKEHIDVPLPTIIHSVPSLLEINDQGKYNIYIGDNIKEYIFELNKNLIKSENKNKNTGEPESFSFFDTNSGVISDCFSFLDQSAEEMSAKGDGGLRQMYNYASIDFNSYIDTPDEDYVSERIDGDMSLEKLIQMRDSDVSSTRPPPNLVPSR